MSEPRKFRKKPVVIEAMQFTGLESLYAISPWMSRCNATYRAVFGTPPELTIHTLEGPMTAQWGDWIIKGVEGEFYPCKPSIFEATYEAVKETHEINWGQHQEYGWQNTVTDFLLRAANEDESRVIALLMARGRHEFEKLKAERGWPEDAAPLWQVRWTYLEKKETT